MAASYVDFLEAEETLPKALREFLELLENKGWIPQHRRYRRGIRYWCPCEKNHCVWVTLEALDPVNDSRISFIWKTTCLAN